MTSSLLATVASSALASTVTSSWLEICHLDSLRGSRVAFLASPRSRIFLGAIATAVVAPVFSELIRSSWNKGREGQGLAAEPARGMFLLSGLTGSYAAAGLGAFFGSRTHRIGGVAYLLVSSATLLFSGLTCSAWTGLFGSPISAASASEGR